MEGSGDANAGGVLGFGLLKRGVVEATLAGLSFGSSCATIMIRVLILGSSFFLGFLAHFHDISLRQQNWILQKLFPKPRIELETYIPDLPCSSSLFCYLLIHFLQLLYEYNSLRRRKYIFPFYHIFIIIFYYFFSEVNASTMIEQVLNCYLSKKKKCSIIGSTKKKKSVTLHLQRRVPIFLFSIVTAILHS